MALADFLSMPVPSANVPDGSPIAQALVNNAVLGQQQAQQHQPSKFRNFLGALGDALMVGNGGKPLYRERQQQQQLGSIVGQFLGADDSALAPIFAINPEVGAELYKIRHPASETPAELKEFEYYQGLDPTNRPAYEKFLQLTHPGFMAPITLPEQGAKIDYPGASNAPEVTDQAGYDALPNGATYTSGGKTYVKGGQSGASPAATFPGR
jgi:hypothetical protein